MKDSNYIQLVGYIDEELKETKAEDGVWGAIHLVSQRPPDEGAVSPYQATMHTIVANDELAMYALSNLERGSRILVEGEEVYGQSTDKKDQYVIHVLAHALVKLEQ